MPEHILLSLVAGMFGLLCLILGWLGSGMSKKLDDLPTMITAMGGKLHERINVIDTRLTKVETRCDVTHREGQ